MSNKRKPTEVSPKPGLQRIVRLRRSPSSAFKVVYLILFVTAAIQLRLDLLNNRDSSWVFFSQKAIGGLDYTLYTYLLQFFAGALILHLLRMYLSMEDLEDPCSDTNERCFRNSSVWFRRTEQIIRLTVIAVLSMKLISLGIFPKVTTLNATAVFLCVLYGLLIAWDVFVMILRPSMRWYVLKWTFPASLGGMATVLCLFFVTQGEPSLPADAQELVVHSQEVNESVHELPPKSRSALMLRDGVETKINLPVLADEIKPLVKLLADGIRKAIRPESNVEIATVVCIFMTIANCVLGATLIIGVVKNRKSHIRCISQIFSGVCVPYYGERCTIGSRQIRGKEVRTCDAE